MFAALPGQLEGDAGDAFDIALAVSHGVDRDAVAGRTLGAARFSEIKSSQKLADDQHVGTANELCSEGRTIDQRIECNCRPKIGKDAEFLAQTQQTSFGAK